MATTPGRVAAATAPRETAIPLIGRLRARAENGKLHGLAGTGALWTGDFLAFGHHKLFKARLAIVTLIFVDGHAAIIPAYVSALH